MGAERRSVGEWGRPPLKSGKQSARWQVIAVWYYCPVVRCEKCDKPGSPVWVRRWYYAPFEPYLAADRVDDPEPVLCMGCANRLRPLWKSQCIILENHRLLNTIKREIGRVNAANRR